MREALILLTKNFPYDTLTTPAESYLSVELPILAKEYSEVTILATEAPEEIDPSESLPDNVRAIALGLSQNKRTRAKYLIDGVFGNPSWRLKFRRFRSHDGANSLGKRLFARYIFGKAKAKYRKAQSLVASMPGLQVDIYSFWLFDTAIVAIWLADRIDARSVFSRAHRYDLYSNENRLGWLPARPLLSKGLDAVFACSKNGASFLLEREGFASGKVHVSYLGTRNLSSCADDRSSGVFRVVSCSRLAPVKRVDVIMCAMEVLDRRGLQIAWTHFGGGPELEKLVERAERLHSVKADFVGQVSNTAILSRYEKNGFDLFINVSKSEGIPISIMEASSCSIPTLATDVGGTSEIVRHGLSGYLLTPDLNAEELASEIETVMRMPRNKRQEMGRHARELWSSEFRAARNVREMLETVDKAVVKSR